jgi:hypothetical protein
MSSPSQTVADNIRLILNARRILKRHVILCEGQRPTSTHRYSPQSYRQNEKFDDAAFYRRCIPVTWREKIPVFINCGDRSEVIATYFGLLETHQENPSASYLTPELLYGLVDLDLDVAYLPPEYDFATTDEVLADLYQAGQLQTDRLPHHRLLVTGLIHKEAYFLHPSLQTLFDGYPTPLFFDEEPLNLRRVYQHLGHSLADDGDLARHFERAQKRLSFVPGLEASTPAELSQRWLAHFAHSDDRTAGPLITALLMTAKAKTAWRQISHSPSHSTTLDDRQLRDDLRLQIASRISQNRCGPHHHLYELFHTLQNQEASISR